MQRRALLASLAVGASAVAGCLSGQDSPQSDDTPSDERETDPDDPGSQPDDATADRDGDTVTVTTDRYGDDEHPPDATFALTRADTAAQRVVAEQVMASDGFAAGGRGLRNLLAAVESDVAQVVLQTDEHALREPDSAGATKRVRFRGQAYEITRQ